MQTFLPYKDFTESAKVLDNRRLGKQRIETKQIYFALTKPTYGWKNHPAVKMWTGYEDALLWYGMQICAVWRQRGYKDAQYEFFRDELRKRSTHTETDKIKLPPWIGDDSFHTSHQSNLMRKDATYYSQWFKDIPNNLPYVWPSNS